MKYDTDKKLIEQLDEKYALYHLTNKAGIPYAVIEDDTGFEVLSSPIYDAVSHMSEEKMLERFSQMRKEGTL